VIGQSAKWKMKKQTFNSNVFGDLDKEENQSEKAVAGEKQVVKG
jgi:hypothetical protein